MRKNLTIAILCGTWLSAAIAFADDGKATAQAKAERAKLLKVIAELKSQVAKDRDLADRQKATAEKARAVAQFQRAEAENRVQRFAKDKRVFEQKRRVLILRSTKDGKLHALKLHAGTDKLEHLRAAIKHLQAAGQKELAQAVAQQTERLQAELHKAHAKGGGKNGQGKSNIDANLRELSMAILQLRKQMQGLQKSVEQLQKRRK